MALQILNQIQYFVLHSTVHFTYICRMKFRCFPVQCALMTWLHLAACKPVTSTYKPCPTPKVSNTLFAIVHVNVISMNQENDVLENTTVLIKDGKIMSIGGSMPDSASIIDGTGKWLIPGLIDMHVHIPVDGHFNTTFPTHAATLFTNTQDIMTPFVVNGVTSVFELNARAGHFGQRNEIARGDVIGPRMALAAMIDGGNGSGRIAHSPADGRQAVRMAKAEGYEFIKIYSHLDTATFQAIVDEAGKQGMKVTGHIPNAFEGSLRQALAPHFGLVAHAEEFTKQARDFSYAEAQHFAQLVKQNGTWLTPTLIIIERAADQSRSLDSIRNLHGLAYVHPLLQSKWVKSNIHFEGTNAKRTAHFERMISFNKLLVKAFREAGVPMVMGTDAGCSGVIWGFSLHDEMQLMAEAGMTTQEVLASGTRLAAAWLGIDHITGTIETGKYADLVLLDANPLININNTRRIAGVFVNGRWMDKSCISAMLSDLSKRNTASLHLYDWSKRADY